MSAQGHTPESARGAGASGAASASATTTPLTLRFSTYELDFARHELRHSGALVALQPTPLRVLLYLAEHRDRTVPRRELLDAIWPGVVVGDEALTTALAEARHAVGDDGAAQRVIRTLKGAGYRFVAEGVEALGDATDRAPSLKARGLQIGAALIALTLLAAASGWLWQNPNRSAPGGPPSPHMLAVIPFRSVDANPALDSLANGLTAEISEAIQPPANLIPAATMLAHRGKPIDVRELERGLGATHVLQGTVQAIGDRVRVMLQLHETNGAYLSWSRTYEEPAADMLAAQTSIASQAAGVVPFLLPYRATEDPEQAPIVKALEFSMRLIATSEEEAALATLMSVLSRDPNNSRAHAILAVVWSRLVNSEKRGPEEAVAKIRWSAAEAKRIAPDSSDAHSAAAVQAIIEHDWATAEREARAGCEKSGARLDFACFHLRLSLLAMGRAQEASEISRSQIDVTPSFAGVYFNLGTELATQRRYADALRAFQRAEQIDPFLLGNAANVAWLAGRPEDYIAGIRALLANRGDAPGLAEIERIAAASGPRGVARWAAEHSDRLDPLAGRWVHRLNASVYFTFAGDRELALAALESVPFNTEVPQFLGLPLFDDLREHPRFEAIVERYGLTEYHAKYVIPAFHAARAKATP